jgi:hypothetical protein
MTEWIDTKERLPDECATVWVSDGKTVGISEYLHGIEEWLYCDVVVGLINKWQPIEYPEIPK